MQTLPGYFPEGSSDPSTDTGGQRAPPEPAECKGDDQHDQDDGNEPLDLQQRPDECAPREVSEAGIVKAGASSRKT